jgi:hypothetical protein
MLRSFSSKVSTLFSAPKREIKITIDEMSQQAGVPITHGIKGCHDKNDQCMHTLVASFAMESVGNDYSNKLTLQAVFYMHDTSQIECKLIFKEKLDKHEIDKDYLFAKCAAESLVRLLYNEKISQNQLVVFQAIRGSHVSNHFDLFSCKLKMNKSPVGESNTDNDVVSTVTAYVEEKKLCILFNKITPEEQERVKAIFGKLFAEKRLVTTPSKSM